MTDFEITNFGNYMLVITTEYITLGILEVILIISYDLYNSTKIIHSWQEVQIE